MDSIPHKVCSKCNQLKPATAEFFNVSKTGKYGVRGDCKDCKKAQDLAYRESHKERKRITDKLYKDNNRIRIRTQQNAYNQILRSDPNYLAQINTPEYRERKRITWLKYRQSHRAQYRTYDAKRRGRKQSTEGFYTEEDLAILVKQSKGLCWWCGKKYGNNYHIDHRIPLAKGGSNWPHNLCISCPKCNRSKNAKMPYEFNGRLL